MKIEVLKEIIERKSNKEKFAVLTNLSNGNCEIFNYGKQLSQNFKSYKNEIENYYNLKKNGIISGSQIFILNYTVPIEVIIVGAVHIAQNLIELIKDFDFSITVVDPREYFTSKQRFQNVKIINEWPYKALEKIQTKTHFALITLTHDPKIDDPALNYALKNKFFYIGALGSKKTHENRLERLKKIGFSEKELSCINSPIGIKLGGKSTAEIALSIAAQLVSETNKI